MSEASKNKLLILTYYDETIIISAPDPHQIVREMLGNSIVSMDDQSIVIDSSKVGAR